jgi:glycosyltransferase involved in cell wall biosynthesis
MVSVVISNYNYARFLRDAIDSALTQTHPAVEVIVVDDGSTDDSRAVIAGYGDRVTRVLKTNGGMGSAYNAGFPHCRGDTVVFLDSDDMLLPTAAAEAAAGLKCEGVAKAHWPLAAIDECGKGTGELIPGQPLPDGDFKARTIAIGPDCYLSPPTSGNAWSSAFLREVLPLPEDEYRQHADAYLTTLAPVFGSVKRIAAPQSQYRIHSNNDYAGRPADEKNRRNLGIFDRRCCALSRYLASKGVAVSTEVWKAQNPYYTWMSRLDMALRELAAAVPPRGMMILIDEDQWADGWGGSAVLGGRRTIPFIERDGKYWGPPANDAVAVCEVERLRAAGAEFMAVGWPAFWWLDHYVGLHRHLRANFRCIMENERVVLFDLRQKADFIGSAS